MSFNPTGEETVGQWLERTSSDKYEEALGLFEEADIYWGGLANEVKHRVYQQFDFGGYHDKWMEELRGAYCQYPNNDVYDNPIKWDLCDPLIPEYNWSYLDYESYLIDLDDKTVGNDTRKKEDIISSTFSGADDFVEEFEGERQLASKFCAVLVKVLRRLLQLFVMQNADLMTNAPTFRRLMFMENEATLAILQHLHEKMKEWAKSVGNAAATHTDQEPCHANTAVQSTSSTEGGRS